MITFNEELNPLLAFDVNSTSVTMFNVWNLPSTGYNIGATATPGTDLSLTNSTLVSNTVNYLFINIYKSDCNIHLRFHCQRKYLQIL